MFPSHRSISPDFKPLAEAAGIEPAQDSPGYHLTEQQRESARRLGYTDAEALQLYDEYQDELAQQREVEKQRQAERPHAIYVATDGDVCKVGYSVAPHARVYNLSVERRKPLSIAHVRWVACNREARIVETNAHHALKDHLLEQREWFTAPVSVAIAAVDEASKTTTHWMPA